LEQAHFHDPALPYANVLVVFTTEGASSHCRFAVAFRARRLDLDRLLELARLLRRDTAKTGERAYAESCDSNEKYRSRI
jgi:hypothetical protein